MHRRLSPLLAIAVLWSAALSSHAADARTLIDSSGEKGGLAVVLGCDDLALIVDLHSSGGFVVQALDKYPAKIDQARRHIGDKGVYGPVSANVYDGKQLPYIDNLVNLVVLASEAQDIGPEITRVLAPGGSAVSGKSGERKFTKPVPKTTDEWTHWLHGPDNNAVASDTEVDVPRHLQWIQDPIWISSHNLNPGVSAMVTSSGRLFSIINEMPAGIGGMDDKWILTARDAFNGLVLWTRPIKDWGWKHWAEYEYKVEMRFVPPFQVMRRLVAAGDRAFVTPGFYSPVHVLDAASGKELRILEGTEKTFEILHVDGVLFLAVNDSIGTDQMIPSIHVMAVDPNTGKTLWKTGGFRGASAKLNSLYRHANVFITAGSGGIIFVNGDELVCLGQEDGKERWRAKRPGKRIQLTDDDIRSLSEKATRSGNVPSYRAAQYLPNNCTLLHSGGIVVLTEIKDDPASFKGRLGKPCYTVAYDARSGKELWRTDCVTFAHFVPPDLFVINGLVWTLDGKQKSYVGLALRTGKTKKSYPMEQMIWKAGGHQLCFRNKATSRMLVFGRRKTEFVDIQTGKISTHAWIKGMCNYGVMPANGMIYYPPHNCACIMPFKLAGFRGQTANGFTGKGAAERLFKGEAYAKSFQDAARAAVKEDWPMYRRDNMRKGNLPTSLPTHAAVKWSTKLGGALSQVISVGDKLYVAEKDAHRICCLDAEKGNILWRYTAGGRIDSAPTYAQGRLVAGSRDGHVYCLDASTGKLVWRFRAAPHNAGVIAFNQIESAWPVHGSLVVLNSKVYCLAGRSTNLNGGMYLYSLDLNAGEVVQKKKLVPDLNSNYETKGALLADLLTVDGDRLYLRHMAFPVDDLEQVTFEGAARHGPTAKATGLCPTSGFLDTSWFNTTVWGLGSLRGQIMSYDKTHAFGVLAHKNFTNSYKHDVSQVGREGYLLFCKSLAGTKKDATSKRRGGKKGAGKKGGKSAYVWSSKVPIRAQSLVVGDNCLYLAGTRDLVNEKDPWGHVEGRLGGVLAIYARADGKKLGEIPLKSAPVFDGLSASNRNVFLVTKDGRVNC